MKVCFNPESELEFSKLPVRVREFIFQEQYRIDQLVRLFNPEAVCTSGYRNPVYNFGLKNSNKNSVHCVGAGRDYRKSTIQISRIQGLRAIVERGCVHFESE